MADQPESFTIFNEQQFRHLLDREIQRATRYQDFLSLCFARPDVPGAPGHGLLTTVARRAAQLLRSTDMVGLFDDLIAILLVHTSDSDAAAIIGRLREQLESETFQAAPDASPMKPALRVGLASFPIDATMESRLIAQAQTRLAHFEGGG